MLKRKKCNVCGEGVKKSQNFCPNCGTQLKDYQEKWGMLGRNDIEGEKPGFIEGIGDKIINKMISSTFKMLENEMGKGFAGNQRLPQGKMKIMINGKEISPEIKPQKKDSNVKFLPIEFSNENLERWKKINKKEPKSKLKRVEDKIEYEVEIPGVKSIKDISIIKLENSLEIKAVGDKTGYLKRIPIDLPLKKYSLVKGILTLELDTIN
ncbi:zinc ribbon domain-containing protein [Candidatus Pacearchaeota archaeon]|nr:zinc ribbon domain-containing protein [Candidatus Pacearchaeota archaeon]